MGRPDYEDSTAEAGGDNGVDDNEPDTSLGTLLGTGGGAFQHDDHESETLIVAVSESEDD